jgi:hypothetical protein
MLSVVIAELDPAIHTTPQQAIGVAWMRGSSPRMTSCGLLPLAVKDFCHWQETSERSFARKVQASAALPTGAMNPRRLI